MYQRVKKLTTEAEIKERYPVSLSEKKAKFDTEIKEIFKNGGKFLLIVGPCSADDPSAVLDYCERLKRISENVDDKIAVIPRIYTTKPRSEASAYRGILHSPDRVTSDIDGGIIAARKLMIEVAENFGFFAADEMLYPSLYHYFDDLISYVTIGARSSENQLHRMFASGLDVPVGIKNPMNGNLKSLVQGVRTSQKQNDFAFNGYEVKTCGNEYAHGILRGFTDADGRNHSNCDAESIKRYIEMSREHGILPQLIVDCNHSNSDKNCFLEPEIALSVVDLVDVQIKNCVKGLMIESYLLDGRQEKFVEYGKSLTDPCLGIEKTERLIYSIAERL